MVYFITFSCYGSHLHGDPGAVDRWHNRHGQPTLEESAPFVAFNTERMAQPPYRLDDKRRPAVLAALQERCEEREWFLFAAHVRTNRVHVIVEAQAESPERVMTDLKAFASRRLNSLALDEVGRKRWARHGSTKRLWTTESVLAAIGYVINGQGNPMSLYEAALPPHLSPPRLSAPRTQ